MSVLEKVKNIRTPKTKLSVLNTIKTRFSPRVFSSQNVVSQDLKIILEAARLTPSAKNYQPWFFYIPHQKAKNTFKF